MKIWMVSSECSPWAKSGGLGDAVSALARELARSGHEVRVFLPGYGSIPREPFDFHDGYLRVPLGADIEPVELRSQETDEGLIVTLVENPDLFGRQGLYGDSHGEYLDNDRRFVFFSRVVAELAARDRPDILHVHDWQGAPALFLMRYALSASGMRPAGALSVHNAGYQGSFAPGSLGWLSLPEEKLRPYLNGGPLEFYGRFNFLKAGLLSADVANTVSPSHARETLTPELGFGLDGVFRSLGDRYSGIVNGIDTDAWNPESDRYLGIRYGPETLGRKPEIQNELCRRFAIQPAGPVFGLIGRLVWQKGIDLVLEAIPQALEGGAALVVLGTGERDLEDRLRGLSGRYPGRAAVHIGFSEELSHLVTAGADFMLVPSRYEPCGLVQMQAMRYGTLPVAHRTGGLADTISDLDRLPEDGTGFLYDGTWPEALAATLRRAMEVYSAEPARLRAARLRAMRQDFSWGRSAREYERLYERALSMR